MFIDLHTHSVSSDDSRAAVEQYVKWVGVLRRKGYSIDGFVLTEHRKFDFDKDYSALAEENDVLIMKGSELDTNMGHFLVYGVSEALTEAVDFSDVTMDAMELVRAAEESGAIAIPAHPGRFGIGLCEFSDNGSDFGLIRAAEGLNGSNRPGEQERAEELIKGLGRWSLRHRRQRRPPGKRHRQVHDKLRWSGPRRNRSGTGTPRGQLRSRSTG